MIAIPDFSAGAMENWGLITYRLTSLLSDPKESSTGNKQWVETVVAHELAHQVIILVSRVLLKALFPPIFENYFTTGFVARSLKSLKVFKFEFRSLRCLKIF